MARRQRVAAWTAAGVAVVALLLVVALGVITTTDRGRERVRRVIVQQLDGATDGTITIRRVEGNLLRRIRLIDVSIVDEQGRPFLEADTVFTRFSVRGLLRRQVMLTDVRLVEPVVVLDQPPGERWNYKRIFRIEPDTVAVEPRPPGWGDWIELSRAVIVNGRVTVRSEWAPPEGASPEERQRALEKALAGETRELVVEVPGGHQSVMDFRELHIGLRRVTIAHPDTAGIPIDVARFSGLVQPFEPPAEPVRDLSGKFRLVNDTLFFSGIHAVLTHSRLAARGKYALQSGELLLHMRGGPVAFTDLQWLYPALPDRGGGSMRMRVEMRPLATRVAADEMNVAVGDARVLGRFDVTAGDTLRIGPTDLDFARVPTGLVEDLIPALDFPRPGTLTGRFAMRGTQWDMHIDGDVRFADVAGPASRIVAVGQLALEPQLRFRDMRMRFLPVHASLVRAVAPDAPVRGTLEGFANLTGQPDGLLQLDSDLTMRDPQTGLSRVRATGGVDQRGDELRLQNLLVRTQPLQGDLLREYMPALPRGTTLVGQMRLDGFPQRRLAVDGDLALRDPRTGESRFGATGSIVFAPELRFDDLLLRLHGVQLALLQEQAPELPDGVVTGAVRLDGAPSAMLQVDGTLAHAHATTGRSEVEVQGGIAFADGVRFRDFDVRMQPLSMRLVQGFAPDLPIGGVLTGTATLDGVPATEIAVRGDVVHVEAGERSHVVGSAVVATAGEGWASIDATLRPLSLVTVGRFAPAAGLHGSVTGQLTAAGRLADLRIDTQLDVAGGGLIVADGRLDLASEQIGYALNTRMTAFNLAAITRRAPAVTDLTGTLMAEGRGTDPATMNARIAADLVESEIDDVAADEVRLRLAIAQGLAHVDSSVVRLGTAEALLDGSFGLTAVQRGELRYAIRVDSLHAFASWVPGADTAVAAPPALIALHDTVPGDTVFANADLIERPDTIAPRVAPPPADRAPATAVAVRPIGEAVPGALPAPPPPAARNDTIDAPAEVVVADAVLGADSALIAAAQGVPPVPRDSLAGSLRAAGTLRGNIEDFDIDGRADVEDFVYGGTSIGRGRAEYALANLSTDTPDVTLRAQAGDVIAAGLAFDSVTVDGEYRGMRLGEGRITVAAFQDAASDYRLDAEFMLSLERNELRLADAALRFDTVTWQTAQPAVISWGPPGIEVDNIDLVSNTGGRIFADGLLPVDGTADLSLVIENLEVAQLMALLQADVEMTGRLDVRADVTGTQAAPVIEGTATLTQAVVDGSDAPDVRATFAYADLEFTADAVVVEEDRLLAEAEARLPINLALTGDVAQRLLAGPIEVDIRADSLPIEAIPPLSEYVENARGRVSGAAYIRGTFETPLLDGAVNLDLGTLRIVPLGVRFDEIAGTMTLDGSMLVIDSLVARSGGPIRIEGEIDVSRLSNPVFDLVAQAENARVIDNGDMSLRVDADITVAGPFDGVQVRGDAHARSGMMRIPRLEEIGSGSIVDLDDAATFQRVDTTFIALRDELRPRPVFMQNLDVDIGLTIDRDVWLRSSEANVEIYTPPEVGPLRVGLNGGQGTLTLLGTINTDRGEYEFMSRRFQLTRGAVSFTGEADLDPFIQLAAEHEVRLPGREAFEIRVVIDGRLSDFTITLESTSQPPISQTDLLSYVAFGRDASSLLYLQGAGLSGQGGGPGELVGNVAALATQQLAAVALEAVVNQIEADAARELKLDVFRITPADLPPEVFRGDYTDVLRGAELEAGRYVSPRLFLAGQIRGAFTRPGVRLEYWSPMGLQWQATWQPRFVPAEPTLTDVDIRTRSVLGLFLFREWRF
jgi:translocation and assembly module TamB